MHMHGTAIKRAPPPPRATFIPNTDMPFRRGAKTANNNAQDSFYIVRRAASTGHCDCEDVLPENICAKQMVA